MKNDDVLSKYAIILIYPDGMIDKIMADEKVFHMEYFLELIKNSKRLSNFIKRQKIFIPEDTSEFRMMRAIEIDTKLAEEGVIGIHNLYLDEEMCNEIEDWNKSFYLTLPEELSEKQKEIMDLYLNNYDLSDNWFSVYNNGELVDIEVDEFLRMMKKKEK